MAVAFFSYFDCQCFVDSGAIPPLVKTRGWMKTSQCQSVFGCTYPSFFHVFGRSLLGTSQNMTVRWDVRSLCQIKFFHSYSTVFTQRYPTLCWQQCWLFFQSHFCWLAEVWVRCEHLYRPLSLSVPKSHWDLPHWSVNTQLIYEAVIHRICLYTSTVGGMLFTFHPYLMQMAFVNSCLFSAYPIALSFV